MSNEKRFALFVILMMIWMMGFPYVARLVGLAPPARQTPPAAEAAAGKDAEGKQGEEKKDAAAADNTAKPASEATAKGKDAAKGNAAKGQEPGKEAAVAARPPGEAEKPRQPEVPVVPPTELVLGSEQDKSPDGYHLEARLNQKGAGIGTLLSSRYGAEYEEGVAVKRPLRLIDQHVTWPDSLTLTLNASDKEAPPVAPATDEAIDAEGAEDWLDSVNWEVVRDDQGRIKRPAQVIDPATNAPVEGEEITFRAKASNGVVVTKTFRLGKKIDGLEVEIKFDSPDRERKVVYNLRGPHGIPIEGEWYTSTFLDLFFGQLNEGRINPDTHAAVDVAKATADRPIENTALPLAYSGVENQYFATLLEPVPLPTGQQDRWDSRALGVAHRLEDALHKSQIGVVLTSRPITVAPGKPVVHTYRVFAGPKLAEALAPYKAEDLALYRKNQWIPKAPEIARYIIAPTLNFMYGLTERVARFFGGTRGNYGIAIILLTILVRALMFPLGRKQALAAQKMQALNPELKALQEKYKDDKERLTKETFALYKKHGVNPMGGCLPALIQLPIFVGLWQAINTSVPLRHATFLWIRDLAAPDMMFRFPVELPLVGSYLGHWFNLLPFLVVALMLIQTKLFSPPATTPEAEQSQKVMKFMMIFMAFMFYKVPSGLGIYFITSSLWAIAERLLLPKVTHAPAGAAPAALENGEASDKKLLTAGSRNGDGRGSHGDRSGARGEEPKRRGWFGLGPFFERLLEEAQKDPTYRKLTDERDDRKVTDEPDGRKREKGDRRPRPRRRP